MEFLRDSNAVTFGPTDADGNSDAERLSGLDDMVVDVMAFSKRLLYEPDDLPTDLQADLAKHLCDMFARQEKWLHPGLTTNGIQHDQESRAVGMEGSVGDVFGADLERRVRAVGDVRALGAGSADAAAREFARQGAGFTEGVLWSRAMGAVDGKI